MEHLEPPAYTPSATPLSLPSRRSIQDTRELILANARILKPRYTDTDVELIVAKRKGRQESAEEIAPEYHYAFLVSRKVKEADINIIIKGKPKDSIEEALEWMLDRTEVLMEEVLLRHGNALGLTAGCCHDCTKSLRGDAYAPFQR